MKKENSILTADGHKIYGTQTFAEVASGKLVIFVHGFTGHKDEHIFFNGAKFFNQHGYDAFRFDLYSGEEGARHFRDTSISLHGKDITAVLEHFKPSYEKIYLVGHSYGGTSLLCTDASLASALIFWDASYITEKDSETDLAYNPSLDAYLLKDRVDYLVGKKFVEDLKHFPDCGELAARIHVPVKFITAGKEGGNDSAGQKFFAHANEPKALANIPTADHCFNGFEEEDKLFQETLEWVEK
jgi:pimeloyl-ACP methyl ester carboxylesterase